VDGVEALRSTQPDDAWDRREHRPGVINPELRLEFTCDDEPIVYCAECVEQIA
jgi:hypothetical protein